MRGRLKRGVARFGLLLVLASALAGPLLTREARRCRVACQEQRSRANLRKILAEMYGPRCTDARGHRWDLADLKSGVRVVAGDFSGVRWPGTELPGVRFAGCYLSEADLRGADLRDADLRGCHIGGTDFRGADLRGADLRDTDDGVSCTPCDHDEAFPIFRGAIYDRRTRWSMWIDPHAWGMRLAE